MIAWLMTKLIQVSIYAQDLYHEVRHQKYSDRVFHGRIRKDNADEQLSVFIDKWHKSNVDESLHVFLGLTFEEYSDYVVNKRQIYDIIMSRKISK